MKDFLDAAIEAHAHKDDMADDWPEAIRKRLPEAIKRIKAGTLPAQTIARHLKAALEDAKVKSLSIEHIARYLRRRVSNAKA